MAASVLDKLGWKKEGSQRRLFCRSCKIFIYENPLPVAGVVCLNKKKEVLLIKRAIEPAKGKWALPSGFIELHETRDKAARRELYEETRVRGKIIDLIGIYAGSGSFEPGGQRRQVHRQRRGGGQGPTRRG